MSNYYCLVAGLPDIGFEDGKAPFGVDAFKAELSEVLSSEDMRLVDLFSLEIDNRNFLALLQNRDAEFEENGNFSKEHILLAIEDLEDEDRPNKVEMPKFWEVYYGMMYGEETEETAAVKRVKSSEDILSMLYYQTGVKSGNRFVADWFEFNMNVNNIFTALTVRKYGLDGDYVVGDNRVARKLRASNARDFGLTTEIDYFDAVVRIFDESDILSKERRMDAMRWDWIESRTVYEYFSTSRVVAYFIELQIINRWVKLDKSVGEERFRSIIDGFKKSVNRVEVF